jgi:hypothetical protein
LYVGEQKSSARKIFEGCEVISKSEVRALGGEFPAPRAKKGKTWRLQSQKQNWLRANPAAPKAQHKAASMKEAPRFVSELARFPLGNMKLYVARLCVSRPLDSVDGGSTILRHRHRRQDIVP